MLLANYEYYITTYGGSSIPSPSFPKKVMEASSKVNYYTFNRINDEILQDEIVGNTIHNITCQISDLLFEQENLKLKIVNDENKEVASESLGPRSISYVNQSNLKEKHILSEEELEQKIYKIIYQALVHTGLMYRGAY